MTLDNEMKITNLATANPYNDLQHTTLELTAKGQQGGLKTHKCNHILWTGWPDKVAEAAAEAAK